MSIFKVRRILSLEKSLSDDLTLAYVVVWARKNLKKLFLRNLNIFRVYRTVILLGPSQTRVDTLRHALTRVEKKKIFFFF